MTVATLYEIRFSHHAPKDGREGIQCYALADDETTVRDRIDKQYNYGGWKDDDPVTVYSEDDGEDLGEEARLDRVLRQRGDIGDEDNDYSDSYYGLTFWGWTEGREVADDLATELVRLGIAVDWRPRLGDAPGPRP